MFDEFTSQAEFDRARGIEPSSSPINTQQQFPFYSSPFSFQQPQPMGGKGGLAYQPQQMGGMQYGQQFPMQTGQYQFPMQGFGMQNQFQGNPYVNPSYFQGQIPNMPMQQQAPSLMSFIGGKGQR